MSEVPAARGSERGGGGRGVCSRPGKGSLSHARGRRAQGLGSLERHVDRDREGKETKGGRDTPRGKRTQRERTPRGKGDRERQRHSERDKDAERERTSRGKGHREGKGAERDKGEWGVVMVGLAGPDPPSWSTHASLVLRTQHFAYLGGMPRLRPSPSLAPHALRPLRPFPPRPA